MIINSARWNQEEIYNTQCALWYIISFLYENNGHKPVNLDDIMWIIARANKIMFEKYAQDCINPEIFNMFDFDEDLIPSNFRPTELTPKSWMDYMSEAQEQIIEKGYLSWRSYGKLEVHLKRLIERIKK